MAEQIQNRLIEEEMKESYIDYSMSVIVGRALPDVHDGLKPVHRRILYAMHELGLFHNKPTKKSARIVGDTLGRFHPHGDIAVYDALVRMTQDFSLRYPLVMGQGNFGCFTKDTKVILTDGRNLSFKDIIEEHKEGKSNYTFTIDKQGAIKIAEIKNPKLTRKSAKIVKVILDNGEEIKCTPDHRFMLRNSIYKEAQSLKPGDSLMPFYTRISTKEDDPNITGYSMIYNPKDNIWLYAHHLADEWNLNKNIYLKSTGKIRHHIDFNKLNNNPANIKRIGWKEHWKAHYELTSSKHKTDMEYVKKLAEGRKKYWSNPESKKKLSERTSLQNKRNWEKPVYRERMRANLSRVNKEYLKNHPEKIEEFRKRGSITLKKLWQDPEYRKKKSEHLKERWKNNDPSMNKFTSEISKKIWSSPEHRKFISENTKKLWQNDGYRIKMSQLSKKRWVNNEKYRDYIIQTLTRNGDITTLKKFLKITKLIVKKYGYLNEQNYELERKKYRFLIKYKKAMEKFFDNDESKLKENVMENNAVLNHKVINIEFLNEKEDVYDLTIENTHNFALAAGVFVHNSVDGDSSAHMRYTEVKLSKIGEELLEDIEKETVKFVPNFDNSTKEPVVLPSKFPNLLVNGSSGIAVGMATNMPPHNLQEVADAVIKFIENQTVTVDELMQFVKGPDFPTGATILGRNGILNAYKTGRGQIKVRAKANIENKRIIVTEIPYQVNKSMMIEQIADSVREKKIEGISDIRDESDRKGMRIVIELKQNANPEVVLNQLYRHSQLQTTFGVINLALVAGQPRVLDLKTLISSYVKHRKRIVTRRTQFELRQAEDKAHLLEGLKIALANIDPVVKTIKSSNSVEDARNSLIKSFKLTEKQAVAILDMRLQRLTSLETNKVSKEHEELVKLIIELKSILADESKIYNIIKQELTELKQKYHDERRTKIIDALDEEIEDEDLIKEEQVVITMTHQGYVKRLPLDTYKQQKRGGKGIIATETKEEDFVEHLYTSSTHNYILLFTDKGKIFWIKGYKIPDASRYSKGNNIVNLLSLEKDEKISAMIPIKEFKQDHYLLMATKKGVLKKTGLIEYSNPRKTGIIAINLRENDKLVNVKLTDGNQKYVIATKNGLAVRFDEKDVRAVGRNATGVRGIKLQGNDEVIGIEIATNDNDALLTVTEKGYGKRSLIGDYRLIRRGGKGVINIKTSENGKVVAIKTVKDVHELMLITKKGILMRISLKDIRVIGRNTQGVRIMKLDANDKLVNIARIINNGNLNNNL